MRGCATRTAFLPLPASVPRRRAGMCRNRRAGWPHGAAAAWAPRSLWALRVLAPEASPTNWRDTASSRRGDGCASSVRAAACLN